MNEYPQDGGYGYAGYEAPEYMEQEEEWEREGLLDPAWEKQQKKVLLIPFSLGQQGWKILKIIYINLISLNHQNLAQQWASSAYLHS